MIAARLIKLCFPDFKKGTSDFKAIALALKRQIVGVENPFAVVPAHLTQEAVLPDRLAPAPAIDSLMPPPITPALPANVDQANTQIEVQSMTGSTVSERIVFPTDRVTKQPSAPPTVQQVAAAKGTVVPDVKADQQRLHRSGLQQAASSTAAFVPGVASSSTGEQHSGIFDWENPEDDPKRQLDDPVYRSALERRMEEDGYGGNVEEYYEDQVSAHKFAEEAIRKAKERVAMNRSTRQEAREYQYGGETRLGSSFSMLAKPRASTPPPPPPAPMPPPPKLPSKPKAPKLSNTKQLEPPQPGLPKQPMTWRPVNPKVAAVTEGAQPSGRSHTGEAPTVPEPPPPADVQV